MSKLGGLSLLAFVSLAAAACTTTTGGGQGGGYAGSGMQAAVLPPGMTAAQGAAYCSNVSPRTYPDGLDVEAFTYGALGHAFREATRQIDRFVIVQPSFYGADNTMLLESLDALGGRGRGVAVVDLRSGVLVANLELAGKPTDMLLKPDGGELYVISPEAHGLQAINTGTHEVGDYMVLGSAPTRGVLSADASLLYVSDTAAGRVTPVDIYNRRIIRDPGKGFPVPAGDSPSALRFDPQENLLLVVSQGSGDLAVIRVRTNFLVTMIPVGDHPQELAVKLF
jgi:YVTN family beta-propeller protein